MRHVAQSDKTKCCRFIIIDKRLACQGCDRAGSHCRDPVTIHAGKAIAVCHINQEYLALERRMQTWMARYDFDAVSIDLWHIARHSIDKDVIWKMLQSLCKTFVNSINLSFIILCIVCNVFTDIMRKNAFLV